MRPLFCNVWAAFVYGWQHPQKLAESVRHLVKQAKYEAVEAWRNEKTGAGR